MPFPLALLLALAVAFANDYANHYNAPVGILLSPLVSISITALLHLGRHPRLVLPAAICTALLICLHDAGIKLYGGGAHDLEGQGVITVLLFAGLLPSYLLQLFFLTRAPAASASQRLGAALALPLLVGSYLYFFSSYLYFLDA